MRLTISGLMSNGTQAPQNLISTAGWVVVDTSIAKIENGEIIPLQEGETELICNIGGVMTKSKLIVNIL